MFNTVRENLKNPKKKAITQLVLYIIFFIIVFIIVASNSKNDSVVPIVKKTIVYDYTYNININNEIKTTTGKSKDENDIYSYDHIKELINKSEFIEKTTYKDDSTKATYNITANDYYDECSNKCDSIIVITVYEKEYINNVVIDLNNVTDYIYTIDIKYENIVSK